MSKEAKRWAAGMLFIGIVVGISGNLAANMLDRLLRPQFGVFYDFLVAAIFIGLIWFLERAFTKMLGR